MCSGEATSMKKSNKVGYKWIKSSIFLQNEAFLICSSMNFQKMPISLLSGDKTALLTQFSPFQDNF